MKKIEAVIRQHKLDAVKGALLTVGVQGMTVSEVFGQGAAKCATFTYRGLTAERAFAPQAKIETIVADDEVDRVIDAIFQSARTGAAGDGQILVSDLDSVTRIRTGEMIESDSVSTADLLRPYGLRPTAERVSFDVFRQSV